MTSTAHATGTHFPLIQDILKYVYARGKGPGPESEVGTVYWIRDLLQGFYATEALRRAMRKFGNQPLTGAQVQWRLEHLSITPASIKETGAEGLVAPITLSCRDHEGGGGVKFQQWDGHAFKQVTSFMSGDRAMTRKMAEEQAAKYAAEKKITPRDCGKED